MNGGYAPVQKPPPLDWDVLSTLTHLSSMERVPLPMIMHVTRNEDGGAEARHLASAQAKASKFFTVSKKGRTVATFQESIAASGQEDDDGADRARLPNYLSNPYSSILFGAGLSSSAAQAKKSRRKSSVAFNRNRMGSVFGSTSARCRHSDYEDEGDIPEFLSSTFTRNGLNVAKLRDFEVRSSARERQMRLQAQAEQHGYDEDADDGDWYVDDGDAPPPQLHYSTPRLDQPLQQHRGAPMYDTSHPRPPRGLQQLLFKRQQLTASSTVHGRHCEEDVNWISEYSRGGAASSGTTSPLHRRQLALTLASPSEERARAYPLPASPRRPQAHPMLRNPHAARRTAPRTDSTLPLPTTPRTPDQKLRELGSEVKLRM